MIRRITLIEPKNEHLHVFSRFELPRLGGVLLATIMRDRGYDSQMLYMKRGDLLPKDFATDLVGISTITPTAESAYALADSFRARGIPVVMGGPHVSFLPEEALRHADYCISGEGETSFPLLVEALNSGSGLSEVPGLAWMDGGTLRRNPTAKPIEDLDSLPFPDFSLVRMSGKGKIGSIGFGKPTIPIQTSRGCPYNCTFCSVTGMFGHRYRHRSTQSLLAELSRFKSDSCFIFFYDDNFCANPRKTKELLREMIALKLGFQWSTQVRTDVAKDPELLDLMVQAGCTTLFIGLESVDPAALLEMQKRQSVEEIRVAIREIRRRGIHVHGMFVFGFDSDTPATTRATVDFAISEKIDSAQFLILTPLPGSSFYNTMAAQGRLIDRAWDTYDTMHVKFHPKGFTAWELQRAQISAHRRYYALRHVLGRLLRGRVAGFAIGLYAGALNHRWQRQEKGYLRLLRLVRAPRRNEPAGVLSLV